MSSLCWPSAGGGVSMRGPPWANLKAASGTAKAPSTPRRRHGGGRCRGPRNADRRAPRPSCAPAPPGRGAPGGKPPIRRRCAFLMMSDEHRLALAVRVARLVVGLDHVGPLQRRPQAALLAQIAGADHHHARPWPRRRCWWRRAACCRAAWARRRCADSRSGASSSASSRRRASPGRCAGPCRCARAGTARGEARRRPSCRSRSRPPARRS